MKEKSLKDIVLSLDDGTRTTQEIAALAGCGDAYVRTCRQRRHGRSVGDLNYLGKPGTKEKIRKRNGEYTKRPEVQERIRVYQMQPEVKAKASERQTKLYWSVPFEKRQEFCRKFGASRATREICNYARVLRREGQSP